MSLHGVEACACCRLRAHRAHKEGAGGDLRDQRRTEQQASVWIVALREVLAGEARFARPLLYRRRNCRHGTNKIKEKPSSLSAGKAL